MATSSLNQVNLKYCNYNPLYMSKYHHLFKGQSLSSCLTRRSGRCRRDVHVGEPLADAVS